MKYYRSQNRLGIGGTGGSCRRRMGCLGYGFPQFVDDLEQRQIDLLHGSGLLVVGEDAMKPIGFPFLVSGRLLGNGIMEMGERRLLRQRQEAVDDLLRPAWEISWRRVR